MKTAARIKELRTKKGMSMRRTAELIGVPASTYRDWEKGRRPSADGLTKIAKLFGVSVAILLGQEEENRESLKKAVYYLEAALELVKNAGA